MELCNHILAVPYVRWVGDALGDCRAMAMTLLGGDLKGGKYSTRELLSFGREMVDTLSHVHAVGVS